MRYWLFAVVLIVMGLLLDLFLQDLRTQQLQGEQEREVTMQLSSVRARLEDSIYANLLLLHGLAAHISVDPGTSESKFEALAREIMRQPNMLVNVAVAPDFTILYVYPREGNESIVGVNYREVPDQWEQARRARDTGRMVLAGPLKLIQGTTGPIGRVPVFVREKEGDRFWGLVSAVMDMDKLLANVGMADVQKTLDLAIRGRDGKGAKGEVFYGRGELFHQADQPILLPILLPNGAWQMAAVPHDGWKKTDTISHLIHVAVFGFLLFVLIVSYRGKKRQTLLEEARAGLARAQATAKVGSWEWDPALDLVSLSDEAHRILGLAPEKKYVDTLQFSGRFHPADAGRLREALFVGPERGFKGLSLEARLASGDGPESIVALIGEPDPHGGEKISGTIQDITLRKRAEEKLRISEGKFRGIFTHANVGMAFADGTGRIQEFNRTFQEMVGYSEDELRTLSFRDFTHPDDAPVEEANLNRLISGQMDSYRMEKQCIVKAGRRIWVDIGVTVMRDEKGKPDFFVGIVADITERMRAREAIREAEERYRTLFNVSPDGLIIFDPETTMPIQFNHAAHEHLGYTREEFAGLKVADYEGAQSPEEIRRRIGQMLRQGRDDFETIHRRKDGDLRNVFVTVKTVEMGGRQELFTVFRDITAIRRAEEDLENLSQRLLLATGAGNIGVWDWEVASDVLTWNDQMYDLYGVPPEEFKSMYEYWRSLVHPDDLEAAEGLLQETLDGKADYDTEFRIIRPDGRVRYIKAAASMVGNRDEPEYRMIGANWDITDQKEAENRLRDARRHAYDILESTTDAFFEVDAEFNLTHVNTRAETSLGLDSGRLIGKSLWQIFPRTGEDLFHGEFRRAVAEQQVVTFEDYYPPNDTWFEVWAYPTPRSLSVYFHDVTARKRLQEDRERIFQLSLDMICVIGFDGYLKELNPSWERTLGWSREELMSRPFMNFVHAEDREATIRTGGDLVDGKPVVSFENRYSCKDGSFRWMSWNAYPVVERSQVIAVARDVTENIKVREILRRDRDELETRVRERTAALAEANRSLLAAKDAAEAANRVKTEFLANISHELRTPLNPIIGLAEYLQETDLDGEQRGFIADIRTSAGRLLVIIDRLIELTRIESKGLTLNIQPFSPEQIFNGVKRELGPLAEEKGLTLETRLAADAHGIIESDPRLLGRVLNLLVENAIKFTDQGRVTLNLEIEADDDGNRRLHITVTDTGPGVPPEKMETLFVDLSQADGSTTRRHGGLGLGLTLARRIVTGMKGNIWAENREEGGSRFHLTIPLREGGR